MKKQFLPWIGLWLLLTMVASVFLQAQSGSHPAARHGGVREELHPVLPAGPLKIEGIQQGGPWQEYELFYLDTLFNIINSGVRRMYGELNGRMFILTTIPEEVALGQYIFLIPEQDTVLFDISRYVNPGYRGYEFDITPLRLLIQGPPTASAFIVIGDQSAKLKPDIDFILDLDSRGDGDANNDGITHQREDQFVELVNWDDDPIDISGWEILMDENVWHTFPPGTALGPGKFLVIFGGGLPAGIPGEVGIANYGGVQGSTGLRYPAGTITLNDAGGQAVDSVDYDFPANFRQSYTRNPDANGEFVPHTLAISSGRALFSPGRTARGDTALSGVISPNGRISINEIHADPSPDNPQFPPAVELLQSYPNPFNSETVIEFTVPERYFFGVQVELIIFNTLGQKVRTLASGQRFPGTFRLAWDGRNDRGERLASGIYVSRLIINDQKKIGRMVLVR
ncbi:MAG: lamin tail domain-containing protein [Calditrichaceae bacterium]|nr:lamin tail domain-containing protein [Calditrichia bacterium]NUQ41085.1 lamin tail domain-containing protein [Calditrichaceae bacterium]